MVLLEGSALGAGDGLLLSFPLLTSDPGAGLGLFPLALDRTSGAGDFSTPPELPRVTLLFLSYMGDLVAPLGLTDPRLISLCRTLLRGEVVFGSGILSSYFPPPLSVIRGPLLTLPAVLEPTLPPLLLAYWVTGAGVFPRPPLFHV